MTAIDSTAWMVAVTAAAGFLFMFAFSVLLGLACRELSQKAYRQFKEIKDLKQQRKSLGVALGHADQLLMQEEELIQELRAELRSTNRRLTAAELRAERLDSELIETTERLELTDRLLAGAGAENGRLRRQVEALDHELFLRDLPRFLAEICPVPALSDYLLPEERTFTFELQVSEEITMHFDGVMLESKYAEQEGLFVHTITFPGMCGLL